MKKHKKRHKYLDMRNNALYIYCQNPNQKAYSSLHHVPEMDNTQRKNFPNGENPSEPPLPYVLEPLDAFFAILRHFPLQLSL